MDNLTDYEFVDRYDFLNIPRPNPTTRAIEAAATNPSEKQR